jgi:hypothetical protein
VEWLVAFISAIVILVTHNIIADALFVGALELALFASDRCGTSVLITAVSAVILSITVVGDVDALLVVAAKLGPVVARGINLAAVFPLVRAVAAVIVVITLPVFVNAPAVVALELILIALFCGSGAARNG